MASKTKSHRSSSPKHTIQTRRTQENQQRAPMGGGGPNPAAIQQRLGNRGMQAWLAGQGSAQPLQAKLTVGKPDDMYEQEADRVADTVMRMPESAIPEDEETKVQAKPIGDQITPLVQRMPEEEAVEEEPVVQQLSELEEDEEVELAQTKPLVNRQIAGKVTPIHTKGFHPQTPDVNPDVTPNFNALKSGGSSLSQSTRALFEPRFDTDFSKVRVHTDSRAADTAKSINAKAFTVGVNIAFGKGQYTPESQAGKRLLGHELTHVVQQNPSLIEKKSGSVDSKRPFIAFPRQFHSNTQHLIQKTEDPPSNVLAAIDPHAWDRYLARSSHQMLAQMESLSNANPQSEEERESQEPQIEEMIRLNAIGQMASHRATILGTRDRILNSPNSMPILRQVAGNIHELKLLEERLEEYKINLESVSRRALLARGNTVDLSNEIYDNMLEFMTEERRFGLRRSYQALQNLMRGAESSRQQQRLYYNFLYGSAMSLAQWRAEQLIAVRLALSRIYQAYPVFSELDATDVTEDTSQSNSALRELASRKFSEVLIDIHDAIRMIARGDIHPLDLPEMVGVTKNQLPESLKPVLDQMIRDRQTMQFWLTLGLTAAEILLVFLPVVGPALAVSLGAIQLGMAADTLHDRLVMAEAATDPYDEILGVSPPSVFEGVMLGVGAVLLAFGMAGAVRSLRGPRSFHSAETSPSGGGSGGTASGGRRSGGGSGIGGPEIPGGGGPRQNVLLVGAETAEEFRYATEVAGRGHQVTVVNPTVSRDAQRFVARGGNLVRDSVENLPSDPVFHLIREDYPFPMGRAFHPTTEFASARLSRLAPGGRWVVVTEATEFANTLEAVARTQPSVGHFTRRRIPIFHEGTPQSTYPRERSRFVLIFEKAAE